MRFEDFIAPLSPTQFRDEYWDRRPVHVPSSSVSGRTALLNWATFNDLLALRSHWSTPNINLVMNSRPIDRAFYMEPVDFEGGAVELANPVKVDLFLAMGASAVANNVEHIAPRLKDVTSALGDRFSARTGANVYCSFKGVQAFASHCDLHEVFVVQCEGNKTWNIYENRAASPTEAVGGPDAQSIIDSVKGPVLERVTLKPGDLLYIPRGYYHDALATDSASLHITFAVLPLTCKGIFALLEQLAMEEEVFRRYLPDPRDDDGHALGRALSGLAERLAGIVQSKRFASAVAERQRGLWGPQYRLHLPQRRELTFYARSSNRAEIQRDENGSRLIARMGVVELDRMASATEWVLERPAFSLEQLWAQYRHIPEEELAGLVKQLVGLDLIFRYTPDR